MQLQRRNLKRIWYANFEGHKPVTDGRLETGEYEAAYGETRSVFANVSAARGESFARHFGESEDYDKVVLVAGTPPVTETSVLWIDCLTNGEKPEGEPFDYIVVKVAESPNFTSLAVKKVNVSGTGH